LLRFLATLPQSSLRRVPALEDKYILDDDSDDSNLISGDNNLGLRKGKAGMNYLPLCWLAAEADDADDNSSLKESLQ
jgi:hypothetical protein